MGGRSWCGGRPRGSSSTRRRATTPPSASSTSSRPSDRGPGNKKDKSKDNMRSSELPLWRNGLAFSLVADRRRLLKAHVPTSKICLLLLLNLLQICVCDDLLTDKMPRRVGFVKFFQQTPTSVSALLLTALLPRQGKGITQKTVYKTYSVRYFAT